MTIEKLVAQTMQVVPVTTHADFWRHLLTDPLAPKVTSLRAAIERVASYRGTLGSDSQFVPMSLEEIVAGTGALA